MLLDGFHPSRMDTIRHMKGRPDSPEVISRNTKFQHNATEGYEMLTDRLHPTRMDTIRHMLTNRLHPSRIDTIRLTGSHFARDLDKIPA